MTVMLPLLTHFGGDQLGQSLISGGAKLVLVGGVARTIPAASTPVAHPHSMLLTGISPCVVPSPWTSIS